MSHDHHHGSCSTGGCCHHNHEEEMESSCCQQTSCCEGHSHHHHHKYSEELLALADEAWMEVLKEKIKDEIRKTSSQHLDAMAKTVADANHQRWKFKMDQKREIDDFEAHLHDLLRHDQRKG